MPKVVQKKGYLEVQNSGFENFTSFLGNAVASFLQQKDKQKIDQAKAQDTIEDVLERRRKFMEMDPEKQDMMKQTSPELVTALFDDTRLFKLQKQKVPKGYKPHVPQTRGYTSSEKADKDLKLAQTSKAEAEATAAQSNAVVTQKVNEGRLEAFRNPKGAIDEFYARYGKNPSSDELQAYLTTDEEGKKNLRSKIVGTLEYKTAGRDKEITTLMSQYQPQTQQEIDQLKQAADYVWGLSDKMPVKLPPSLEKQRTQLEQRRVAVTEANLGISRQQLAMDMGKAHLEIVQQLQTDGVDPSSANTVADSLLKTGKPPKDISIPASKLKAATLLAQENGAKLDALRIQDAQFNNPAVQTILATMRAKLSQGSIADQAPDLTAEFKRLYTAAGLPFDEQKANPAWYQKVWNYITSPAGSTVLNKQPPGAVPAAQTPTTSPLPTGDLSPEIRTAIAQKINEWGVSMAGMDENQMRVVTDRRERLRKAIETKDENAVRAILLER